MDWKNSCTCSIAVIPFTCLCTSPIVSNVKSWQRETWGGGDVTYFCNGVFLRCCRLPKGGRSMAGNLGIASTDRLGIMLSWPQLNGSAFCPTLVTSREEIDSLDRKHSSGSFHLFMQISHYLMYCTILIGRMTWKGDGVTYLLLTRFFGWEGCSAALWGPGFLLPATSATVQLVLAGFIALAPPFIICTHDTFTKLNCWFLNGVVHMVGIQRKLVLQALQVAQS